MFLEKESTLPSICFRGNSWLSYGGKTDDHGGGGKKKKLFILLSESKSGERAALRRQTMLHRIETASAPEEKKSPWGSPKHLEWVVSKEAKRLLAMGKTR